MANSYTPHNCDTEGQYRCEGTECGDNETDERYEGICDKDGCDYAMYRLGNPDFYGPNLHLNSDYPVSSSLNKIFYIETSSLPLKPTKGEISGLTTYPIAASFILLNFIIIISKINQINNTFLNFN